MTTNHERVLIPSKGTVLKYWHTFNPPPPPLSLSGSLSVGLSYWNNKWWRPKAWQKQHCWGCNPMTRVKLLYSQPTPFPSIPKLQFHSKHFFFTFLRSALCIWISFKKTTSSWGCRLFIKVEKRPCYLNGFKEKGGV